MFHTTEPGSYYVKARVKAEESSKLTVRIGGTELEAEIKANEDFTDTILGEIEVSETGDQIISIHPVQDGWKGIEIGQVMLEKQ
jgi:hypothetical protein